MRKLLLALLLFPSALHADSITNGSVGLIKISTGVIGTRNWGDKYNENFQIIANTMTTMQTNITSLNTSTGINIPALYATINSTSAALYTAINSSNTAFQISNSTGQSYPLAANSTMTALSNSTTTLAATIAALSLSTTIIFNQESPDISNRTYYLHNETTGTASLFRLMSSSPSVDSEITRTQSLSSVSNIVRISSHITPANDPGVRKIPAGTWSFTSWASASNITALTQLVITVSTCAIDGTAVTEVLSTTQTINDLNVDRLDSFAIQQNDIVMSTSDRIVVQYFARTLSVLSINVSLYFAGTSHASHLTTPIGTVYKFTQLSDAPSTLVGQQGKYLSVNDDQTALVFITTPLAGGSSGGGQRAYDLFVGTPGTPNIDVTVGGSESFDSMFATIAARGLTFFSSSTYRILMSNGLYQISNTTIPAGVEIYCGSSVTFTPTNTTDSIFTVYGKIFGPRFDVQNRAFAGPLIQFKAYGAVENIRGVSNAASMNNAAGVNMTMFLLESSSFCRLTGTVDNYVGAQQDTLGGGLFRMIRSSDCYVNLNTMDATLATTGKQSIIVSEGDRNIIEGNYEKCGSAFICLEGGNIGLQIKGRYHITQAFGGSGFIYVRPINRAIQCTTGTVVSATFIYDVTSGGGQPIIVMQGDQAPYFGFLIYNTHAYVTARAGGSPTFFTRIFDNGIKYTILANNHIFGMPFLSNSGLGTVSTPMANTNDITLP